MTPTGHTPSAHALCIGTLQPEHLPAVRSALATVAGVTQRDADSLPALTRYLERNPALSVIAHDGHALAGFVLGGHDGRRGYLHHLVVLPPFRRRGIATRLVLDAIERLRAIGMAKVHADVLADNAAAQAFWAKLGWQRREDVLRYSIVLSGGCNA